MGMEMIEPEVAQDNKPEGPQKNLIEKFSFIFNTGVSEIKRKGAITRLNYEIKGLEREKEKHIQALGHRAWEAHVEHPDFAGVVVNLKELQIEINRLETQFGEHETQIQDIEVAKSELTEKFNQSLDQIEQQIVPHRQKIETINAEKEDNKIQIEELRSKQDYLSQQVRFHQKNIQELDLGTDAEKTSKIELEKGAIRNIFLEKSEIECKIPFLMSRIEKLKISLGEETGEISRLEGEKDTAKRDFEHRMKDYNNQIHQLEDRKKQIIKQKDQLKKEMDPFLYDLGKKVEQHRVEESSFREVLSEMDELNESVESRRQQIVEAESLSRAMDRNAWTNFLVFACSLVVLFISLIYVLVR
jgi:chromosome segregation ATPase